MRPLEAAPGVVASPDTGVRHAAPPSLPVDARVLVITANGTDAAFGAIAGVLGTLGTPYDVLNATTGAPLTADTLATGDHGRYHAIFLDVGDLGVGGTSAFSADEWATLAAYEAKFGVRRVALYATPTPDYGLTSTGSIDPMKSPIIAHCTDAGAAVFVGTSCLASPITIDLGWAYPAAAADGATVPIITDAAGHVYAATRTYPDGREALALTFAQASYALFTLQLGYGLVNWATRGLFVGERHVYLSPQLDDLFLSSTIYPEAGATYRITDGDLQALADWQAGERANPLFAALRLAWACNAQGSGASDPLTQRAQALGSTFSWISHTWDHADLTDIGYAAALTEFTRNDQTLRALGLMPYATINAVTPGITGLDNIHAMQAAYDTGIRYLVSDTSVAGEDNPTPNAGFWNALVSGILEIPRIPTNLDYDVSQPAEWLASYKARVAAIGSYADIISSESRTLVGYMVSGNNDPLMFHQANTRQFAPGHSLLTDLLGATLDRYQALSTVPILSPTQDELAQRVMDRMTFNASGVAATIVPGASLTVQVTNAAKVPVTGLCTPGAESYGGQQISWLALGAGETATVSLADCSGTGTGGTSGSGGAGGSAGASGTGGTMGTGGTTGTGGATGIGGASGLGGATGAAGSTGMGGGTGISGAAGTGGETGAGGTVGSAGTSGAGGVPATGTGGTRAAGGAGGTSAGGSSGTAGMGGESSGTAGVTGTSGTTGSSGAAGAAGSGPGGAAAVAVVVGPVPSAGCACAVDAGAGGTGAALLPLLGVLAVGRRRRR